MAEDNVVVEQIDRDTLDEIWITALRHQPPKDSADDAVLQILARHRLAAQALKEAEDNVAVAFQPLAKAIDDLIAEYGADRPDHQYQPLMLPMIDVKRIRAAIATQAHEPSADEVERAILAAIPAVHILISDGRYQLAAERLATAAIAAMRPASERAGIAAWLRNPLTYVRGLSMAQSEHLADAIERGDHIKGNGDG